MPNIRNLQKKDASQVALLIPQLTQNIVEPENLVKRIERLVNQKNSQFLVADLDGKVVGFGGLVWYSIPSKGMMGWVEELVVDSQSRGQGIGRTLIDNLLKIALQKKIKQIILKTANPIAKKLYEKIGFVKKEEDLLIRKYY